MAGDYFITTGSLSLNQESKINTDSDGSELAGYIGIYARDKILILNGSNIYSRGNKGNINITASSLSLNQNSEIKTNSDSGNAGNIDIITQNLLLRRHSKISTTVGTEKTPGDGGTITIDAKDGFVVADPTEDSDIIANSFGGKGGTIEITANRVLGFQNRGKLSSAELKAIENNGTSDISASSDVGADGEVAIETLSIDPSQGLVALPTNLVDPSRLIAQGCSSNNSNVAKGQSEFVITGRGGLPPSPDNTLKAGAILPDWVVNNTVDYSNNPEDMTVKEMNLRQLSSNTSAPLVEAVGMVRSANGDIVLTTQPTTATLVQSGLSTKVCGAFQGNVRK
ncbi:S-layer family protein [Nostoc sp. NMS9]|uniref:S-layer family protein n=1 Tax=Nostoc sp. NMS9 TaxID=2815393 RepID=UPI0025EADDC7|nr:S-layer family protein [Nostoc sp. NMS9]MBN3944944.1 S-layer family protein [Nostoc sp. NMS9]